MITSESQTTIYSSDCTLKIISTRTHIGPGRSRDKKSLDFSKAANKIKINNDLKITVKDGDSSTSSNDDSEKKSSNTQVLTLTNGSKSMNPKVAFLFMEAWDIVFKGEPGTPDYVKRSNTLNTARRKAYESLGINPDSENRPELTEEQRLVYNETVKPCSFDYYEVRLSFKQTGHKAVRSKTYRFLVAPSLTDIERRLRKVCSKINSDWSIISVPTN